MRKWETFQRDKNEYRKVMLYDNGKEAYLFLNTFEDDFRSSDMWYETINRIRIVSTSLGEC